jgi:hypothetical protein
MAGRKPGTPKTGGRVKGQPNKATASLKDLARKYTDDALLTLADIMANDGEPAAARVSAANALLDRGYGKPSQVLTGDDDGGPIKVASRIELIGVPSVHSPA